MRHAVWISAAFALTVCWDSAEAQRRPPPRFEQEPSEAEVEAAWPAEARAKGVAGAAVMRCAADAEGRLSRCQVLREAP